MRTRKVEWIVRGLFLCGTAALLSGCGGEWSPSAANTPAAANAPTAAAGAGLTGAGATFPYPLYSKWFADYHQKNPAVTINYQSIGSGGGIQQLKNRTVDFGASDAPLSDAEMKEMPAPVLHLPTVAGAVVLAYNLPNGPAQLKLTPEAVAGIYLGTITKWNDPAIAGANPGANLPGTPIMVAHRSDGSGTSNIFTTYLSAVSPQWKSKVGAGKSVNWPVGIGGKGSEGVTSQIKQSPGGFGYVELAYALQNGLRFAQVKNASGSFVTPDVPSTTAAVEAAAAALEKDLRAPIVNAKSAGAYPIAGLTYLLVYREQPDREKGRTLVELLRWCLHDGQSAAAALSYAPLPAPVVKLNETALRSITLQGQPLLSGDGETAGGGSAGGPAANAPAGNTP